MNKMADIQDTLRLMEDDMGEPEPMRDYVLRQSLDLPPEERVSLAVQFLDEICAMANRGDVDQIAAGQILFRAQLVAAFVMCHQPRPKVVSNNG